MIDKTILTSDAADPARMAEICRMRAEEMFVIASAMRNEHARGILERQAQAWEKMAAHADRGTGRSR